MYFFFQCNIRRIVDYPNIWNYLKDLYQKPGFGDKTCIDHDKKSHYLSLKDLNPNGVVPRGPEMEPILEEDGTG